MTSEQQYNIRCPDGHRESLAGSLRKQDITFRRENITAWALSQFRTHYGDNTISKWDIFHYCYGILYHPDYRERYQANLKRDLLHIPFAAEKKSIHCITMNEFLFSEDFWDFAAAGAQLANLHVNYEMQPEYDKRKFIQPERFPDALMGIGYYITPNVPLKM